MSPLSGAMQLDAEDRPARRAVAITALAVLGSVGLLIAFVIITNFGLVLSLLAAFVVFFAGAWGALSRREWWRWICAAVGAIGAIAVLVVVIGIGWVSTAATVLAFVLCLVFTALTRYALGDRREVDG